MKDSPPGSDINNQILMDYVQPEPIDLSKVDPALIEQAKTELDTEDNQAKTDLEDRIKKAKERELKRSKPQYDNPAEQVQSLIRKRNIELETNLAQLMVEEKERLTAQQYKGIKTILRYVGWKPKPIDQETVLNNVVDNLIYATEATYERKKNGKSARLNELRTAQKDLREYNQEVKENYGLRDHIKTRRGYLQEQISLVFKDIKDQKNQTKEPGYDRSLDKLIKNREEVMEKYEVEYDSLGYALVEIEENLVTNDQRITDLEAEEGEANVHYQIALSAERKVKRNNDQLQRYKKKGTERMGLLGFYEDLAQDEVLGKDLGIVVKGNSELMDEIVKIYQDRLGNGDSPATPSKSKDYIDKVNDLREETLDKLERKLEQRYMRFDVR